MKFLSKFRFCLNENLYKSERFINTSAIKYTDNPAYVQLKDTLYLLKQNYNIDEEEIKHFKNLEPIIINQLASSERKNVELQNIISKIISAKNQQQYNYGITLVESFKLLCPANDPDRLNRARILGYCVELMGVSLDIIQNNQGKQGTIIDYESTYNSNATARLIEAAMFKILKLNFNNSSYYTDMIELFHAVTYNSILAFFLELDIRNNLDKFTMNRYINISKFKTSYPYYILPVFIAMQHARFSDTEIFRQVKNIMYEMAYYFSVKKDFENCYKSDSNDDIKSGKCTWLAAVALQRCNENEKIILKESYGSPERYKIAAVKELYNKLGLRVMYEKCQADTVKLLCTQIQQMSQDFPHAIFHRFLKDITV